MDNVQLVIPMSGKGQRFKNAGYTDPKPLIEVDGEPMVHWVTKLFPGVKDVIFICNIEHLEDTDMPKRSIAFLTLRKLLLVIVITEPYGILRNLWRM